MRYTAVIIVLIALAVTVSAELVRKRVHFPTNQAVDQLITIISFNYTEEATLTVRINNPPLYLVGKFSL